MRNPAATRAFTLIEGLVVAGAVLIVIALLLPNLKRVKTVSLASLNISNIRQMGMGLGMYADANRGLPPTYGKPAWPAPGAWNLGFGPVGDGGWFEHRWLYSYAVTAALDDTKVANAGGRPTPAAIVEYNGAPASMSDYMLTHTLYASPAFFSLQTRRGAEQFGAQPLSSIVFPSDKGVLMQGMMYHFSDYGPTTACCMYDLPSPIVFGDLSVSEHVVKRLPTGTFNPYASMPLPPGVNPDDVPGGAILDTINGIAGRDR